MAKQVGLREFARMRGVNLNAVQKAIEAGRITVITDDHGKPKLDLEQAMADWDANTDPAKQREPVSEKVKKSKKAPGVSAFTVARSVKANYDAKLARLEYETKAGILVEAAQIKLEAFQAARLTRDAILNVPNKISHELAVEQDPAKIHVMLTKALHAALNELAAEGLRRVDVVDGV